MKLRTYTLPTLLVGLEALERFRDEASRCTPVVCRADLPVVVANVHAGLRAVAPRVGELGALLPTHDLRPVLEMPSLAQALLYAGQRVTTAASSGEVATKLAAARRVRDPMLQVAEALAALGMLPAERVAAIRAGSGPYDSARDVVDLVGLYREHRDALVGRTPFTEAWLDGAQEVGAWLLTTLTPDGAAKPAAQEVREAARLRDQLWAMLLERDRKLRVVAAVLFEHEAAEKVPSLQSRVGVTPAAPAAVPDVPPAPPGNSTPPAPVHPRAGRAREQRAQARRRR